MAQNYTAPFEPSYHYHVYNRAIGSDKLFHREANYEYFLRLLNKGPGTFFDLMSYCLMRNHYHLLVCINDTAKPEEVSESFRRFGISYAQAINKQENRMGSLFMRPVKRKQINDLNYLRNMFCYIHQNPVLHRTRDDFRNFKWSSYISILKDDVSPYTREILKICFDDRDNFEYVHRKPLDIDKISDHIIEEI